MTLKIKGHHAVACLRQWQGIALHDLTRPRKPMRHHHNRPCLTGQAVKSDGRLAHLEFSNLQPVPCALQHDPRGDDQKCSEQAEGKAFERVGQRAGPRLRLCALLRAPTPRRSHPAKSEPRHSIIASVERTTLNHAGEDFSETDEYRGEPLLAKFANCFGFLGEMVLQERIELSTSPLPRECSTTELLQRRGRLAKGHCLRGG